MTGCQLQNDESRPIITTNTTEDLGGSIGSPSANLWWAEGDKIATVGMGGGFADTSYPRSESQKLSDLLVANEYQTTLGDYAIVDDYLTYESKAASAWPSVPVRRLNHTYDFDLDLNSASSNPSFLGIDAPLFVSGANFEEVFHFDSTFIGGLASTPSNSLQDIEVRPFTSTNASDESSPRSSTAPDPATTSSGPFICEIEGCHRSYKRVHELRRHRRVHSRTKPHACTFSNCRRSGQNGFTRRDHLKQHLRQVHRLSV